MKTLAYVLLVMSALWLSACKRDSNDKPTTPSVTYTVEQITGQATDIETGDTVTLEVVDLQGAAVTVQ